MGLACIRKPKGLVLREVRSKMRSKNAIQKCNSNRRDSQVQSTGATHKCDQLNHESESLQVCKFAQLESSQVRKFALKKHKRSKNSFE